MDWIPGLSQLKSVVQYVANDVEGARKTQENFLVQCPVVSQMTSGVQAFIQKDVEAAKKTQFECLKTINGFVDGLPIIGHAKGAIHYALGDKDGGDNAMKSSSRTIGVMAGGVGGFFVGGPVGAFAGGVAGGTGMDALTTSIETKIHGQYKPNGYFAMIDQIKYSEKNPSGQIFDLTASLIFDGLAGNAAGNTAGKLAQISKNNKKIIQIENNIKQSLNERSVINKGSKLGRRAKANLNSVQNNVAAPNIPLIEKAFTELKVVDNPGSSVKVANVPTNILEAKLTSALDTQKSAFSQNAAGISQLKNIKAQLANGNNINPGQSAPIVTSVLNKKNENDDSSSDSDESLSENKENSIINELNPDEFLTTTDESDYDDDNDYSGDHIQQKFE